MHHLNGAVISTSDNWEHPWFARWDQTFGCITLPRTDDPGVQLGNAGNVPGPVGSALPQLGSAGLQTGQWAAAWLGVQAWLMSGVRSRVDALVSWGWDYFSKNRAMALVDHRDVGTLDLDPQDKTPPPPTPAAE